MLEGAVDVFRVTKRDYESRDAIFRLRYHVYNHLYNHVLKCHTRGEMDHVSQTLSDPLDERASLFLARVNAQPVGSMRMIMFDDMEADENVILTHFKEIPAHYFTQKSVLLSLYCILPEYNNTTVTHDLLQAALMYAVKKKVQRFFVAAPEYLMPYYQHYHFTACSDWRQIEGYSLPSNVMTIDTEALIALALSM